MTSLRSAFDQNSENPVMNEQQQPQMRDSRENANMQKGPSDGPFATITGREPFNTDAAGITLPLNPVQTTNPSASQQALHDKRMQKARVEIDNRFREICREEQKSISYIFFAGGVILGALAIYSFTRQQRIAGAQN